MDQADIDTPLVSRLIARQLPRWRDLPVRPVADGGWNNKAFHLGSDMLVRLPRAEHYASQIEKEQVWLPRLAAHLPVAIPKPLARGRPGEDYPWPWSVYDWIPGEAAFKAEIADQVAFGLALAGFLTALQRINASGGPAPGPHSFHRGGALSTYDRQTRRALARVQPPFDGARAAAIWDEALGSAWSAPSVWVHGDFAAGNLLVNDGRLAAVIDFGTLAGGDPACDLSIAWTLLSGAGLDAFRRAIDPDPATWARARGWTLWKALILVTGVADGHPRDVDAGSSVLAAVLSD